MGWLSAFTGLPVFPSQKIIVLTVAFRSSVFIIACDLQSFGKMVVLAYERILIDGKHRQLINSKNEDLETISGMIHNPYENVYNKEMHFSVLRLHYY